MSAFISSTSALFHNDVDGLLHLLDNAGIWYSLERLGETSELTCRSGTDIFRLPVMTMQQSDSGTTMPPESSFPVIDLLEAEMQSQNAFLKGALKATVMLC